MKRPVLGFFSIAGDAGFLSAVFSPGSVAVLLSQEDPLVFSGPFVGAWVVGAGFSVGAEAVGFVGAGAEG